ncbi:MAG: EMC3/TMCO1 family protein [Candidatus Njordarchaeales archaeon]|mgnify:CR=1 FL=1
MVFGGIIEWIRANFGTPPYAGLFIMIVSIFLAVIYALIQQLVIDFHKVRIYNERIKKWRAKYKRAMKTGNPRLLSEVNKEKEYIMKLQMELSSEQFKPLLISFLLFIIVFNIIMTAYGRNPVIQMPFRIPVNWFGPSSDHYTLMNAFWWYFISYLAVSALINAILKLLGRRPF